MQRARMSQSGPAGADAHAETEGLTRALGTSMETLLQEPITAVHQELDEVHNKIDIVQQTLARHEKWLQVLLGRVQEHEARPCPQTRVSSRTCRPRLPTHTV